MIFENKSHTVDAYVFRIYNDVLFWTDLLSDRKRICISEDDDTYLEDFSPAAEEGALENQ